MRFAVVSIFLGIHLLYFSQGIIFPSERSISNFLKRKTDLITGYFHFPNDITDYAVYIKDGKYGLIQDGKLITEPIGSEIKPTINRKFILNKADSSGSLIIFKNQQIEVPQSIQMISEFFDGRFALLYNYNEEVMVMNIENGQIIDSGFYKYEIYEQGFIHVVSDTAWKIIDTNGLEIVPWRAVNKTEIEEVLIKIPESDFYTPNAEVRNDTALIIYGGDRMDLVSFYGDTLISNYHGDYPREKEEQTYRKYRDWYKWDEEGIYFINKNGDTSKTFKNCNTWNMAYPYVVVYNEDHKEGLFNVKIMKFELLPVYKSLEIRKETVIVATENGEGAYSIQNSGFFIDTIYDNILFKNDELQACLGNKRCIYKDSELRYCIQNVRNIWTYGGLDKIQFMNNKIGFYDKSGKEIIAPMYDDVKSISGAARNQFFALKSGKYWMVYDEKQKRISQEKFSDIRNNYWFTIFETGDYFRDIYLMDDFGRISKFGFRRQL